MFINWKGLRSGSDIRGIGTGTSDEPLYLSDEVVRRVAVAFIGRLCDSTKKMPSELTISVGHDPRISSERIRSSVIAAVSGCGATVLDCGLSSTPAMFMTTVDFGCHAAIQITASHHPSEKNGLKFFTPDGGLESTDIADILDRAERNAVHSINEFNEVGEFGKVISTDSMRKYSERLREMIKKGVGSDDYDRPLEGFCIAVDAGNGAGGFYARDVLEPLGADISGSRFLEPDGAFPNHIPNPEDAAAMRFASEATLNSHSDLGIIFDTDVDRAGCVGADGTELNRNRLVAVASYIALQDSPGGTIVTDSVTSDGLTKYIESLGGEHIRYMRGYKNVINKQLELTARGISCPLAIETSGHAAFSDNYFLDDGAYLVTKIIILAARLRSSGKTVADIVESLEIPADECELRLKILDSDFAAVGERFIDAWREFASNEPGYTPARKDFEGIRFSTDADSGNGWIIVRLSVHDPVIVVNSESNSPGGTRLMLDKFRKFADDFGGLQ